MIKGNLGWDKISWFLSSIFFPWELYICFQNKWTNTWVYSWGVNMEIFLPTDLAVNAKKQKQNKQKTKQTSKQNPQSRTWTVAYFKT